MLNRSRRTANDRTRTAPTKTSPRHHLDAATAALIGALVVLVLSPVTQGFNFLFNEYLSRPILTLEYVEVVPEEIEVPFPALREVQALLTSQGYRSGLMQGRGLEPALMVFQTGKDTATSVEVQSAKAAAERMVKTMESRIHSVDELRKVLDANPTDAQIREVAAKYQGPMATAMVSVPSQDVRSLKATLVAAIESERAALAETSQLSKTAVEAIDHGMRQVPRKIKFKLSVLNRGSTDGLVRHVGELRLPKTNLHVQVRRTAAPANTTGQAMLRMAVPVAVMNPQDTDRATSVGKVEKNSMGEFWMELDGSSTSKEALAALAELDSKGRLADVTVVLRDHKNNAIERVVSSDGSKSAGH